MTMRQRVATFGLFLAAWANLAAAPAPETRAQPDRLTPSDAEMVVKIHVRQMLQTPLLKKHAADHFKQVLEHNAELQQLLTAAGIKPLEDIDTLALSTSGNPAMGGKLLAVVRGNFDPDKARAAAEDYAKKHPGHIKSLKDGDLSLWEITSDNKSFFAAFADKKTLVMTPTQAETVAVVRRADQPAAKLSTGMQAALEHVKGNESIWMAAVATNEIKELLKGDDNAKDLAASLQSLTGTLELNEDVRLALVVHTDSPKAATKLKGKLDELMPVLGFLGAGKDKNGRLVKEILDNLKLAAEQNDVSVRLQVTKEQLEKVEKKDR